MNFHIRYINAALAEWDQRGIPPSNISIPLALTDVQVGDTISHSDFPNRWLIVLVRHIDLTEPGITLFLDLLPERLLPDELPENVFQLFRPRE